MNNRIIDIILIITSFVLSRFAFSLINDPEGPNLLIVTVLAIVIFTILSLIIKFVVKK